MEEDSGERDEGEQLDMGSPGKTSTRQKPMAHSDRGLMCFETRRGLRTSLLRISDSSENLRKREKVTTNITKLRSCKRSFKFFFSTNALRCYALRGSFRCLAEADARRTAPSSSLYCYHGGVIVGEHKPAKS